VLEGVTCFYQTLSFIGWPETSKNLKGSHFSQEIIGLIIEVEGFYHFAAP
jgi:hypothetical protein